MIPTNIKQVASVGNKFTGFINKIRRMCDKIHEYLKIICPMHGARCLAPGVFVYLTIHLIKANDDFL